MSAKTSSPSPEKLAKAMSHELRVRLLRLFDPQAEISGKHADRLSSTWNEFGGISPNVAATVLGEPLTNVSYHVRMLDDLGCVRQVDAQPRRGAIEHYYVATVRPAVTVEVVPARAIPKKKS